MFRCGGHNSGRDDLPFVEISDTVDGSGVIYRRDRLIEMFGLKPGEIPFLQQVLAATGTASRTLILQVDPPRRPSMENENNPSPVAGANSMFDYKHGMIAVPIATDITPVIVPVGAAIRDSLHISTDNATTTWILTFYFVPIPGEFRPDMEILERLADRRKMDRHDSDTPGESFFRMGKLRQMGDADPGT